jgi:hypothetical protein
MLFDVPENSIVNLTLPVITDNYRVLHYDEEPILFVGSNSHGNNIIGSLMCEDEDNDVFRFIHLIVKPADYIDFLNKKVSYLNLIKKQTEIFLLDKNTKGEIIKTYCISHEAIPGDYLPLPNIFNPADEIIIGKGFAMSLKGKIAAMHEAIADRVPIISKGFNQFLTTLSEIIKTDDVIPEIRQLAYQPTSFGLNYVIRFNANNLFYNESAVNEFMTQSIDYAINYLPDEADRLSKNDLDGTRFEKMIQKPLNKILYGNPEAMTAKAVKNLLRVPFDIDKITDQLGMGFDYIEIDSVSSNDVKIPLGAINTTFSTQMDLAKQIIEKNQGDKIEQDEEFKDYPIHVYHLNTESRKGNAHIKHVNQNQQITDSPKIDILGEKSLGGSLFINSMDTGVDINVRAKAKKVNGRYKHLLIEY